MIIPLAKKKGCYQGKGKQFDILAGRENWVNNELYYLDNQEFSTRQPENFGDVQVIEIWEAQMRSEVVPLLMPRDILTRKRADHFSPTEDGDSPLQ